MAIELIAKIAPYNDGFTGMVDADQVLGGGASGTLPAATIADETITYAKMQHVSATDRFLGRDTAGAGDVEEITASAARTILNVADGADVTGSNTCDTPGGAGTDTTAIHDGDITGNGLMIRTGAGAYTNRSIVVDDAKLTISNGDGVSGNPSLGFGSVALADLSDGGTVVTAAAVITDHALLRGAGGARGVQDCGVVVNDSDEMSGVAQLDVDYVRIYGDSTLCRIDATFTNKDLTLSANGIGMVRLFFAGTVKANRDMLKLENTANAADMDGTETSILFRQYHGGGSPRDSGRVTVGTETDWAAATATQDSYMVFQTALGGTVAEKMRISSVGDITFPGVAKIGINCTNPAGPGGIHTLSTFDMRKNDRHGVSLYTYHNTANYAPRFIQARAKGTQGSEAAVGSGDWLAIWQSMGHDGSTWKSTGYILCIVDGAVSSGTVPTAMEFRTGTTAAATRFTIQSDGNILVDTDSEMRFRDSGLYINSSADGLLNIVADGSVGIAAPSLSLNAASILIPTANGIDYTPGSDTDVDIATVIVTGTPRFWWDESEDEFATTHHLNIAGGWSGTFTNGDGDTVTVQDGVITGVV